MPSEKFYSTCPATGETLDMISELSWPSPQDASEQSTAYLTTYTPGKVSPDGVEYYDVHSVLDFNRDSLNRMIRALRRARNAIYGSDE